MNDAVEVIVTGPPDDMPGLVEKLVDERLIACAHLTPITSTYRWQGSVEHTAEVRAAMHTTKARIEELLRRIPETHPYEVPCILVVPILTGDSDYVAWINAETEPAAQGTDKAES